LLEAGSEWTAYAECARKKVAAEFDIKKEAEKLEAIFRST
jgi:hypothetical protein